MFDKRKKRGLALVLSAGLALGQLSVPVYAQTSGNGLCEHHQAHNAECGYTGDSKEAACTFYCTSCNPQTPEADGGSTTAPDTQTDAANQTVTYDMQPDTSNEQPAPASAPAENDSAQSAPASDVQIKAAPAALTDEAVSEGSAAAVSDMARTTEHHFTTKHADLIQWMKGQNVQDGDTIILDAEPYVNAGSSDSDPQVIDKRVTIQAGNADTIHFRSAGIVLGADVTFNNIVLSFQNRIRNAIMANGHTLTLNNVTKNYGTRDIHLFCGGLTGYNVSAASGTHGQIIIQGKTSLGSVYAGSLSSDGKPNTYNNNATITIDSSATGKMGKIYASGAKEFLVDPNQLLNPHYEPDPPAPDAQQYPVTGNVAINLYQNVSSTVDGTTGGSSNAKVTYNGNEYLNNTLTVTNIGGLTVATGNLAPAKGSSLSGDNAEISVSANARLSLVNFNEKLTTGNFTGGGTIILAHRQAWTINGTVGGATTKIGIGDIWNDASTNIPKTNHTYISSANSNDVSFQLVPHQMNPDQILQRDASGAWTVGTADKSGLKINRISIPADFPLTEENNGAEIPVTVGYSSTKTGLASVPVTITVNDVSATRSGSEADGFTYNVPGLGTIEFAEIDSGEILSIMGTGTLDAITPGSYRIDCVIPAAYMANNQVYTIRTTLTVAPSDLGTITVRNGAQETTAFSYGDTITVQFTPSSQSAGKTANGLKNTPAANQTILYYGDQPLTEAVTADSNGMYTLTHDTGKSSTIPASDFTSGNQKTLTVHYGGSNGQNGGSADVSITLNPKTVTASVTNEITKRYDDTTNAAVQLGVNSADYVRAGDSVTLSASGVYDNENAGTNKSVAVTINTKTGTNHEAYNVIAPSNAVGTITKAETAAPQIPELESRSSSSITLKAIPPSSGGAAAEYSINNGQSWQTDRTFANLSAGKHYAFVARYQETANYSVSASSGAAVLQTESVQQPQQRYTVTVLTDGNGIAASSPAQAKAGTKVILTAIPNGGYQFDHWEILSGNTALTANFFLMPRGNVTVKAYFTPVPQIPAPQSQSAPRPEPSNGWHTDNDERYWYDNGVMARDKEVYDPSTDAWYWFDQDGTMATDKDVFVPTNTERTEGKWVRYNPEGGMVKGEDFRYGGWYWFDPITGEMIKDFVFIPEEGTEGKWVYYDEVNGQMHHGESCIDGNWYYFDELTGKMIHGEYYRDNNWYYYDPVTGIMAHGWVTLPNGERAYYDEVTGARR